MKIKDLGNETIRKVMKISYLVCKKNVNGGIL
jgi:hypothetical protein